MMKGRVGYKHEVNFELIKFSKKRGTEERFLFKNVVLDVGFDEWVKRHFTMHGNFDHRNPEFVFLGTGTTEPSRIDLGLETISTTVQAKFRSTYSAINKIDRDVQNGEMWVEMQRSHIYGEGEAEGTWTEAGLAFWDLVGSGPNTRGDENTYTYPYSRSLFRKGLDFDNGEVSAATSTTLVDSSRSWDVGRWDGDYSVYIVDGLGAGQVREISSSTGDTLTLSTAWDTIPDSTSKYRIRGTPIAVTVLPDEFLTIISRTRIYVPHSENHWEGTFLWKTYEVPYRAYMTGSSVTTLSQGGSSIGLQGPIGFGGHQMINVGALNFGNTQWAANFNDRPLVDVPNKRITVSVNLAPSAQDRLIKDILLAPRHYSLITSWSTHLLINPDWSALPEAERGWTTRSSPSQWCLLLPQGQRFQGSISFEIFRVDD